MKKLSISQLYPYLLAIPIFYLVTFIFFKPEISEGKKIPQSDHIQFMGMSRSPIEYQKKTGEQALWNDGMFGGMPEYFGATNVPDGFINHLAILLRGGFDGGSSAQLLFLCLMSFWILLLAYRVQPWIATGGALLFAFSTFYIISIHVGHVTKMWAIGFAPLILAGLHLALRRQQMWLGAALAATGIALQIRSNHLQITFYLVLFCLIYGLVELYMAYAEKRVVPFLRASLLVLAGIGLAYGVSYGRLSLIREYTPHTIRGERQLTPQEGSGEAKEGLDKGYAFSWSQGKWESFTLLIPHFYGGSSNEKLGENSATYQLLEDAARAGQINRAQARQFVERAPLYFGDQPFTAGPLYAGAIVCFLFVLGLFVLPTDVRIWLGAGVLLSLMLAWGRNLEWFNYTLFDYFPLFNRFRSVSMALYVALTLLPLGASLTLYRLWQTRSLPEIKHLYYAFGLTGGVALLFWLGAGLRDYTAPVDAQIGDIASALRADRESLFRSDALRSFVLITLAFGALWAALRQKLAWHYAAMIVLVLAVGDVFLVSKRYLSYEDFEQDMSKRAHPKTEADELILKDTDPHYRVLNLDNTFTEAYTSYYHKSIGGYHPAKMRRYQDLIERVLAAQVSAVGDSLRKGSTDFGALGAVNMLNAKYIKFGAEANAVVPNQYALGNAWWIRELRTVGSPDEEITALASLDVANVALADLSKFPQVKAATYLKDSSAVVRLKAYSVREISYEAENKQDGFLVFSEVHYPEGWQAYIDGQPADHLRVNYVLRGLAVPAGKHEIKFRFAPASFEQGALISNTAAHLLLLLLVAALAWTGYSAWKEEK